LCFSFFLTRESKELLNEEEIASIEIAMDSTIMLTIIDDSLVFLENRCILHDTFVELVPSLHFRSNLRIKLGKSSTARVLVCHTFPPFGK
jgi:hypothetical protein